MSFRLAHLSDPHLLSLAGAQPRQFLNKRWTGGLNLLVKRWWLHQDRLFEALVADLNRQRVDHILCTGDITNLSHPAELAHARRCFDQLDYATDAITVIPGNHDAYVDGAAGAFAETFTELWRSDDGWPHEWPAVRLRGPVAIIALSTARTTPWFTAWGEVGLAQRRRLADRLADPRLGDRFRLVAIHHPPAGAPTRGARNNLRDHLEVASLLATGGVDLVLHGHEHRDLVAHIPRAGDGALIPVRGIQSATYAGRDREQRASYRIYTLSEGGIEREELRRWDRGARRFA